MKKMMLTLVAAAFAVGAFAQAAGPQGGGVQSTAPGAKTGAGKHGAGHRQFIGKKLLMQLNLTPAQQTQVRDLVKRTAEEAKAWQDQHVGQAPDRKHMKDTRTQFMKDLEAILTPEQRTKLTDLMLKAREEAKQKKLGGGAPPPAVTTTKSGGGN